MRHGFYQVVFRQCRFCGGEALRVRARRRFDRDSVIPVATLGFFSKLQTHVTRLNATGDSAGDSATLVGNKVVQTDKRYEVLQLSTNDWTNTQFFRSTVGMLLWLSSERWDIQYSVKRRPQ